VARFAASPIQDDESGDRYQEQQELEGSGATVRGKSEYLLDEVHLRTSMVWCRSRNRANGVAQKSQGGSDAPILRIPQIAQRRSGRCVGDFGWGTAENSGAIVLFAIYNRLA
jgi:hypothetical protein